MVLTNEPGCYFIDALIDKALADATQSKYINTDKINQYRGFGGVRLEDVVMVTTNSVINFTTCPRTIEEVESVLAGGAWPPAKDEAPYLRRQWTKLSADCSTMDDIILN